MRLIDKAAAKGLTGVDLAALPDVATQAVHDYAKSVGISVGGWVSSGLGARYGLDLDSAENVALFESRGSVFFTSDLPPSVWEWWDGYSSRDEAQKL